MLIHALLFVVPFVISFLFTKWLTRRLPEYGLIDVPNKRSSHKIRTPRGGGIAIMLALAAGFIIMLFLKIQLFDYSFYIAIFIIAGISLIDDKKDLNTGIRFMIHCLAASFVLSMRGAMDNLPLPEPLNFDLGWLRYPLSFIWILGVMNIFNFLDGIDGYAGVQTIIMGCGLMLFYDGMAASLTGLVIVAAAAGFLAHNWHPAKIFMGDIGSVTLGFAFAIMPFYLKEKSVEDNVLITALLLWFFLADGTFTLIRRFIKGEKIWVAHRSHLYQRLTISGWTHNQVVLFVLSLQIILLSFIAFWNNRVSVSLWIPIFAALLLFSIMVVTTVRKENKSAGL